jgi:hypothetical protein
VKLVEKEIQLHRLACARRRHVLKAHIGGGGGAGQAFMNPRRH